MTDYEPIDGLNASHDGAALRLTIDRPKRRGAIDDAIVTALADHLERAGQDEAVRVIVLTSSGPDFCTGADLTAKTATNDQRPRIGSTQRRLPTTAHRLVPTMLSTQTPIVCAVRGWAAGLGFQLALAADFCVATNTSKFWEPFMTRGFTPDSGATWLLPRVVGLARARELLLLGRELTGAEAAEWGLIHAAVDDGHLDTATEELVTRLAALPTVAVGLTKWLLHTGTGLELDRHLQNEALALELSTRSEDCREGLRAFREKREPRFEGR